MIYLGLFCLTVGTIGNIFNLIVFLSLKTFRDNSCAFYLAIMSIVDIGQLITGLLTRIAITGFEHDLTLSSLFYCKFRIYFYQLCAGASVCCMCSAAINQFLATSVNPRWQQWSKVTLNYGVVTGIFVFWLLHGIPFLIYVNIIQIFGGLSCTFSNDVLNQYFVYCFTLLLVGLIPMFINGTFAFLAYQNLKHVERRALPVAHLELDKQLTSIVVIQFIYHTIATLPYLIVTILTSDTNLNQDPTTAARLQIALSVSMFLLYMNYAVSFIFISKLNTITR